MPKGSAHTSSEFVKLMFVGASGAGKTGALTSLVRAGYELRILDFDSGLDALMNHCRAEGLDLDKIEYETLRDRMKMTATGPRTKGAPKAYADALSLLEQWPDGSDPAEWGPGTVCVLDSLTNIGRAAFNWAKNIDPANKDPRRWYKTAQDLCDELLMNVTSDAFMTNVIVISHIEITTNKDGTIKHYPSAIGTALGPKIARNFNTLVLSETSGSGKALKRKIKTFPTAMLDCKNPAPMRMDAEYNIEDGMAKIFDVLKGK